MTRLRRLYLVVIVVVLMAAVASAIYLRRRAAETVKAVANCETPAPPAKPTTPPPKLPGFAVEAACGPGEAAKPGEKAPK